MELISPISYQSYKKPSKIKEPINDGKINNSNPKPKKMASVEKVEIQEPSGNGNGLGMNFSFFEDEVSLSLNTTSDNDKPKRKYTKKNDSDRIVKAENADGQLNDLQSNEPYINKYSETNNLLKNTIVQIDIGLGEMQKDLTDLRSSKTLKGKYNYIGLLQGSMGNYIGNKISAIKELNSTLHKCNDLEMRRLKELNIANQAKDDNTAIMDMYSAFVNTPISNPTNLSPYSPIGPSSQQMTVNNPNIIADIITADGTSGAVDIGYANYVANMTPQQTMMALESNPDIQEVVIYNQETGAKFFDVINIKTGESIPNADRRDPMFLENLTIDIAHNIARDMNLNLTFPLRIVGNKIAEYY